MEISLSIKTRKQATIKVDGRTIWLTLDDKGGQVFGGGDSEDWLATPAGIMGMALAHVAARLMSRKDFPFLRDNSWEELGLNTQLELHELLIL